MMSAVKGPSREITKVEKVGNAVILTSEYARHRFMAVNDKTVRITYTARENFSDDEERPGIVNSSFDGKLSVESGEKNIVISLGGFSIKVDRLSASYTYLDKDNNVIVAERGKEGKTLSKFDSFILSGDEQVTEKIETPDGVKEIIKSATKEYAGSLYHAFMYLDFGDEALYGLGQHEEGYGNLRGKKLYLHQANRKSAVPMLVSTKGYGILTDTYSPFIYNDACKDSYLYYEAVNDLDYYFIFAGNPKDVISQYRLITGKASMLPKWAYGYVQSKERYEDEKSILETVEKSRELGIGMDCIVLDWISWEEGKWGQKTYDRSRFPDAKKMIEKLHENNVHFMVSIWPSTSENCENRKSFDEKGLMLKNCGVYNPFVKEGREEYFRQLNEDWWPSGVDAWWCDSSEPLTPEWSLVERPEEGDNYRAFNEEMSLRVPARLSDAFCLYHAIGVYEGQRDAMNKALKNDPSYKEKRVVNLTRSGTIGQQRLGTIMWSGDIAASWDTLKSQFGCGLNFCASGLPYWTFDIGAFFVEDGNFWYWKGDFENPVTNKGYHELYTRWYQAGAFMPMFRAHGTDVDRELWTFGKEGDMFYDAMLLANRLRYELMPYIYSEAGKVWLEDKSVIEPLGFSFADDCNTWDITDQFMFGDSIMVCPVVEPMYYDNLGNALNDETKARNVYLPKGTVWYDFYTGESFEGGRTITVNTPIDKIGLFVKAGSIIPMTDAALSTNEQSGEIRYKVFSKDSCSYIMYNDAGDGYGYENGEYSLTRVEYDAASGKIKTSPIR